MSLMTNGLICIPNNSMVMLGPKGITAKPIIAGTSARIGARVKRNLLAPAGVVWFPEHFDGEAKQLADWTIDPQTQIPYFKQARVSLAKVS